MKYLTASLLFLFTTLLTAQIDTTIYYPLHIGDKWEYFSPEYGYYQVEITGDTLMPNGQTYYIFSDGVFAWRFQRKQNNDLVYYYNKPDDAEHILFDFNVVDKKLWEVPFEFYWWGIRETNSDDQNLLNLPLTYKIFDRARIDTTITPPDTTWGYLIDAYPTRITKGLGITSYAYGLEILVGATINGVGYGTLLGIDEDKETVINSFNLSQNYPNPFNPTTTIKYSLPIKSHIFINIYNALGEKVKSLYQGTQKGGEYTVTFDGSALPSGIYFVRLHSENYTKSIKALLIK